MTDFLPDHIALVLSSQLVENLLPDQFFNEVVVQQSSALTQTSCQEDHKHPHQDITGSHDDLDL